MFDHAVGTSPPDVLFALCTWEVNYVRQAMRRRGWSKTRLLAGWNRGPQEIAHFESMCGAADGVVVNNLAAWQALPRDEKIWHINNGVNLDVFRMLAPAESRSRKVLWCASRYHRDLKGYDELIVPLFDSLAARGIECEAMLVDSMATGGKKRPREMAAWYNSGAVYVIASAQEGTPNTGLEAAASGCTLVSTAVGNMPELIRSGENGYLVERGIGALRDGVLQGLENYPRLQRALQKDIRAWDWSQRVEPYFRVFEKI